MQQVLLVELRMCTRAGFRQPAVIGDQQCQQGPGGPHQLSLFLRGLHQPCHLLDESTQRRDTICLHRTLPVARGPDRLYSPRLRCSHPMIEVAAPMTSQPRLLAVKRITRHSAPGPEHGLPTAAPGRLVAGADRPPPWTTLRRGIASAFKKKRKAVGAADGVVCAGTAARQRCNRTRRDKARRERRCGRRMPKARGAGVRVLCDFEQRRGRSRLRGYPLRTALPCAQTDSVPLSCPARQPGTRPALTAPSAGTGAQRRRNRMSEVPAPPLRERSPFLRRIFSFSRNCFTRYNRVSGSSSSMSFCLALGGIGRNSHRRLPIQLADS